MNEEVQIVPLDEAVDPIDGIDQLSLELRVIDKSTPKELGHCLVETSLTPDMIRAIRGKTPASMIKTIKGRGGKDLSYISQPLVIRKLNFVFGIDNWSFRVLAKDIMEDQAIVHGSLTITMPNGQQITKDQFGGHPVARESIWERDGGVQISAYDYKNLKDDEKKLYRKVKGQAVDLGDTLKAAASDCFKKCASMFGLFADVYAPDDYADLQERSEQMIMDERKKEITRIEGAKAKGKEKIKEVIAKLDSGARAEAIARLKATGDWSDEELKELSQ